MDEYKTMIIAAVVGTFATLLAGKTFRRIFLLPFEWIASKTKTELDDKLVEQAEEDLGIPGGTLPNKPEKKEDK